MAALYWTMTSMTTVGYGDITPCNDIERAFAALVMVVGVLTYSYIVAKMTEIVTYIDINSHSARERMMVISAFMRVKAFPRKLRRRVRKYYRDLVSQNSAISMEFSELPRDLSREVSFVLVNSVS